MKSDDAASTVPPVVSVVVPVYNVAAYLATCLDSILAQTLSAIEIICVDDGSTDRSPEILRDYSARDRRVSVLTQRNGGPSAARNAGVALVRGEYLLFVDSDDIIHPELCARTTAVARQAGADMTYFFLDRTPSRQCQLVERVIRCHSAFYPTNQSFADNLAFASFNAACLRLWKTSYFRQYDLFFPVGLTHEDVATSWLSLLYAPRLAIVPERLYTYRYNPASMLRDPSRGCGRDMPDLFAVMEATMRRDGFYHGLWQELFLHKKLSSLLWRYEALAPQFRPATLSAIRAAIGADERAYLRERRTLSLRVRDFYGALDGQPVARARNCLWRALRRTEMFCRRVKTRWLR